MGIVKQLIVNDKFVCDYESKGDEQEDIELCTKLMRKHGVYREITKEQACFGQAVSFCTTASYLYAKDLSQSPRNGISAAPFVVNSAFALELYLKALSMVHGREQRGHDLVKLFDNLPGSALAAILAQLATASVNSVWNCGVSTQQQVRSVLDELRSVFVDWRYLYEKDRAKSVAFRSLIFVTELLHKTCQGNPKINPPA